MVNLQYLNREIPNWKGNNLCNSEQKKLKDLTEEDKEKIN